MKDIFKGASSAFGLVPGICIMLTNIGLPPGISKLLFGGIVEATGAITLLLFAIRKNNVQALSDKRITRFCVIFFVFFLVDFFVYLYLYLTSIIHNSIWNATLFFPFWNTPELNDAIAKYGSKNDAITNYGPDAIRDMILSNPSHLVLSKILLAVLYLFIFEALTLSFGFAALKMEKEKSLF